MENKKNLLNRILSWSPSLLLLGGGAVVALLLLLAPLLRLALYAVPWYDDFNYGGFAKRMMLEEPGIAGALRGAWECARVQWYAWQGTFSSIFFMALVPLLWGEEYYCSGSIFLILLLTVSVFTLTGTLAKKVLHVNLASSLCLQAVTVILVIELVYTTPSAYFWYNPGIHYIGMHSFAMLFLAVLIRLFAVERIKSVKGALLILTGMLGALLTGGSNFVTTLQGLVLLGSLGILACFMDRKKVLRFLPIAAVYAFAFYKNVSAPGNQVRGAFYEGWGYPPGKAVLRSFAEAFLHLGKFTGWMTLAILLLLIPVIWQTVKKSDFSFRLPGLVLVWSICLYASGFTPSLYSLGHAGLSRALNAVRITFQILLVVNEVYWIGWLRLRLKNRQSVGHGEGSYVSHDGQPPRAGCPWLYYVLIAIFMLLIVQTSKNPIGDFTSWGAYYYIHTGEAYNFYTEYQARLAILQSGEADVALEPYVYKPWMLCLGELSEDPGAEENRAMADWYGKNSVALRPGSPEK